MRGELLHRKEKRMISDRTVKTTLLELPDDSKFPSFGLSWKWMKEERTGGRKEREIEIWREVSEESRESTEHREFPIKEKFHSTITTTLFAITIVSFIEEK